MEISLHQKSFIVFHQRENFSLAFAVNAMQNLSFYTYLTLKFESLTSVDSSIPVSYGDGVATLCIVRKVAVLGQHVSTLLQMHGVTLVVKATVIKC